MQNARFCSPPALLEVAGVLVQKRWEDGATDHDVGKPVGIDSTKALSVTFPTLRVVGVAPRLLGTRDYSYSNKGYRIEGDLGGELEL